MQVSPTGSGSWGRLLAACAVMVAMLFAAAPVRAEGLLAQLASWPGSQESRMNAPLALQLMCLKKPKECRQSRKNAIRLTRKMEKRITEVNARVNKSIRPAREPIDVWSINPKIGDCDDYVMTKRHFLIRAGLPASALRPAMVMIGSGERHLVLLVKTDRGDLVLDNLNPAIVTADKARYKFRKSATANILDWK